jgi:hypothetical protein
MMTRKRVPFIEISSKYVGAPYGLGGFDREKGFDCLSLIISIGRDLGINMPTSFSGYNTETYPSLWESDVPKAKRLLLKYVMDLSEEIHIGKLFVPDLVLVDSGEDYFFGIAAGNGNILSAFINLGVKVEKMNSFTVRRAFRWVPED